LVSALSLLRESDNSLGENPLMIRSIMSEDGDEDMVEKDGDNCVNQ
jgi:hypothetical protein